MLQRLGDGDIRVAVCGVFADDRDIHFMTRLLDPADQIVPLGHIRGAVMEAETLDDKIGEALLLEDHGDFVNGLRVFGFNDGVFVHVAEEADFLFHFVVEIKLRAANQNIRLNADLAQLDDRVLGWFGFDFAPRPNVGNERDMDV